MKRIKGGYYLKARIIQEKKISKAPPHVREIWDYLLMEANHRDRSYGGFLVKRGQLFRSYQDIRDGLAWNVGWRKMTYSENHTKKAMKFLREHLMIATKKELGGVLITILNYDHYQNPKNYEGTNESTNESTIAEPLRNQPLPDNNNELKKDKELKKKDIPICPHLKIIDIYHKKLPMLSVVKSHTEDLKTRVRTRWREDPQRRTLEWWEWYFGEVSKSDFLTGKVKSWVPTFYWLTGPKNMTKVLNGEYTNRGKNGQEIVPKTYAQAQDAEMRLRVKWLKQQRKEKEGDRQKDGVRGTDETIPQLPAGQTHK